jgi:hypothetical protein
MNDFNTDHRTSSFEESRQHYRMGTALEIDMHSFLVVCEIEYLQFPFE